MNVVCIGGGAASFFFAANAASRDSNIRITILEQGKSVLNKVLISGGGRCNLTHQCFNAAELIRNYPRGAQEMLGPFNRFGCANTIEWFESRGVATKTEADGRMFPESNSSQPVADCLQDACSEYGVKVWTSAKVLEIRPIDGGQGGFELELRDGQKIKADKLFIGAGSSKQMWTILARLGHNIIPPVPSLFTFQIKDPRLDGLAGLSMPNVELRVKNQPVESDGPWLITHKGLSGPSILKMSARGARVFHEMGYKLELVVDFRPDLTEQDIKAWRDSEGKSLVGNHHLLGLPKRLLVSLLEHSKIDPQKKFASLSKKDMNGLIQLLKASEFSVLGQNRFKEEFVTAGGVDLREVDFGSFASKLIPNLLFAGEILNIDAVTGGFNFQAAWTGAFIASESV